MTHPLFTDEQFEIIGFCARECELQQSGEQSVACMLIAWQYAFLGGGFLANGVYDIINLGRLVEPKKNGRGFREMAVRVGWDVKGDWRHVPTQIENLVEAARIGVLTPEEWFEEYEEVHPFIDGNGRTGAVLYNWMSGTLRTPKWPPDFWGDPRRVEGSGA